MTLLNPYLCLLSIFLLFTTEKTLSAEAKNISADPKAPNVTLEDGVLCQNRTLDPKKVKGKILVCLPRINARVDGGLQALLAGPAGRPLLRHLLFWEQELEEPNDDMEPGLLRDMLECLLECVTKLRRMLKSVAAVGKKIAVLIEAVEMLLEAVLFLIA